MKSAPDTARINKSTASHPASDKDEHVFQFQKEPLQTHVCSSVLPVKGSYFLTF